MFTVGEFSRVAQVSKRLLRYYDEIDLFKPAYIDLSTGRRFYSAEQMPILNRILALKELGLSLVQIQRLLSDQVSTDEMQGMLLLKKAEIEQQLQTELQRIRRIESRLNAIRNAETNAPLNVVIKQIPAQPVLSTTTQIEDFNMALGIFRSIRARLPAKNAYGFCYCICHSDGMVQHNILLEFGCLIDTNAHAPVRFNDDLQLQFKALPAVETMATTVVKGALETIHMGYTEVGLWAEANGYQLAGAPREISLQLPQKADGSDLITEIQFPVTPISLSND